MTAWAATPGRRILPMCRALMWMRRHSLGFGLSDELPPLQTDWHQHTRHQILYAIHGLLHLEVATDSWVLPSHRAAFLTAGTPHRVRCERSVGLRTVYLDPLWLAPPPWDCRVFTVCALAKELLLYAMRWDHRSSPHDPRFCSPTL